MTDDDQAADVVDAPEMATPTGVDLVCERCSATFHHGGRGRRPTKCPQCRRSSKASAPKPDSAPTRPRGIETLRANIESQLAMLGAGVCLVDPFDGQHIMRRAKDGAEAVANLAATNSNIRKALERGVEMAGWGPVILWLVSLVLPIAAHHGWIPGAQDPARPDEPV